MRHPEIFVSLDIGTTSVKVIVAESLNGQVNIIGVGNEKSQGLSRGVIVDIDQTVESIKKAVRQAEQKANVKIEAVTVGIPSNKLKIEDCHGMIAVMSENREISDHDVSEVIAAAKVRAVPPEREIISVIPEEFIVDGFTGIRDPRGMIGVRLELYARLLTGPKTIIHNIRRCVERAGLEISDIVLQPQAIASVALTQDERTFGTVLIDMGGGQTSASIIYDDQLKYSFVDQEGGDFVTRDISVILNTSLESAERVKREYGFAVSQNTSDEEYFPVETVGRKEPVRVDERYLSEIIEARLAQIFETVRDDLQAVSAMDLPGGFVLTGGAAQLPGVVELAQQYFGSNVRLFVPEQMGMRNPVFSTSVGIVEYASKLDDIHRLAQNTFRKIHRPQPVQQVDPRRQEWQIEQQRAVQRPIAQPAKPTLSQPARIGQPEVVERSIYDDYTGYQPESSSSEYYQADTTQAYEEPQGNGVVAKVRSFFSTFFDS